MLDSDSDLRTAVLFVCKSIEEQAARTGRPLIDADREFLSALPVDTFSVASPNPELPDFVPRDYEYERLCHLARDAHKHDLAFPPDFGNDWQFGAAVLDLREHPLSRLLKWSGIKTPRPRWDRWLLAIASSAALGLLCLLVVILVADRPERLLVWLLLVAVLELFGLISLFVASRRMARRFLVKIIETHRRAG